MFDAVRPEIFVGVTTQLWLLVYWKSVLIAESEERLAQLGGIWPQFEILDDIGIIHIAVMSRTSKAGQYESISF